MSEFKAKLHERAFKREVGELKTSLAELERVDLDAKPISKPVVRKILTKLHRVSDRSERSIKEYIALGNEKKVAKLYDGTIDMFNSAYPFLPESAATEALLDEQKFVRRVASIEQNQTLKEDYALLKSKFTVRKKKNKE